MEHELTARFERAYWRAFRALDSVRLRQWERYRLTLPQLRVLYHIRRVPGVTTGELAAALGITVSTTSGLVIKLADRGLIARTTASDDRRQAPLRLTQEGQTLTGEVAEGGHAFIAHVAGLLGPDLPAVADALERLETAASEAAASLAGEGPGEEPVADAEGPRGT